MVTPTSLVRATHPLAWPEPFNVDLNKDKSQQVAKYYKNKLTYVAVGGVTRNPVDAQQMILDFTLPANIQFNATLDVNKKSSP